MKTIAFTPKQYFKAKQYVDWNFNDADLMYKSGELIIIRTNDDAAKALLDASFEALATCGMAFARTGIYTSIKIQINNQS